MDRLVELCDFVLSGTPDELKGSLAYKSLASLREKADSGNIMDLSIEEKVALLSLQIMVIQHGDA